MMRLDIVSNKVLCVGAESCAGLKLVRSPKKDINIVGEEWRPKNAVGHQSETYARVLLDGRFE